METCGVVRTDCEFVASWNDLWCLGLPLENICNSKTAPGHNLDHDAWGGGSAEGLRGHGSHRVLIEKVTEADLGCLEGNLRR